MNLNTESKFLNILKGVWFWLNYFSPINSNINPKLLRKEMNRRKIEKKQKAFRLKQSIH